MTCILRTLSCSVFTTQPVCMSSPRSTLTACCSATTGPSAGVDQCRRLRSVATLNRVNAQGMELTRSWNDSSIELTPEVLHLQVRADLRVPCTHVMCANHPQELVLQHGVDFWMEIKGDGMSQCMWKHRRHCPPHRVEKRILSLLCRRSLQ